jgi:hypothetical protein
VIVDVARLLVYGAGFYAARFEGLRDVWGLVVAATLAAFLGAFIGARLVRKITLRALQIIVAAMLMLIGAGMASGLL